MGALAAKVKAARDRAIEAAHARTKRGEPAEEPIPAHAYVVISDEEPVAGPTPEPMLPPFPGAAPGAGTPEGAGAQ